MESHKALKGPFKGPSTCFQVKAINDPFMVGLPKSAFRVQGFRGF